MPEQYSTIRGRFAPKKTDDLSDRARAVVGRTTTWQYLHIIEEGGEYAGEWCLMSDEFLIWVPESDIEVINA